MAVGFFDSISTSQFSSMDKNQDVVVKKMSLPITPPPEEVLGSLEWTNAESMTPNRQQALKVPEPAPIVAVIGVGYVGTHLVEAFASHYNVIAYDLSERRLGEVAAQLRGLPIHFTSNAKDISDASHVLISVPTILKNDKSIDTTYLRSAIATVEEYVRPGSTVVVESSVAVGMTRQLVGPLMASKQLKIGMSPERVDPGRTFPAFEEIPKIVSGLDEASLDSITQLYGPVFKSLLPVSSPEVAEMTKLYENCQRMVCAAYANEMADACRSIGIDAWEVSQAAASKPFGYLPFRPGPGIGGHCIPVNPYYLLSTCSMPLLEHATTMSWQRPSRLAHRFMDELLHMTKMASSTTMNITKRSRVLVVGMGFKRGQRVLSNSPGVAIVRTLLADGDVYVEFADPLVPADDISFAPKMETGADWNTEYLSTFDGIIIAVDQVGLDMRILHELQGVMVHDYSRYREELVSCQPAYCS